MIAAEASSVHYALKLMDYWESQNLDLDIFGVGSKEMEDRGFRRFGNSEDMAIVGLVEVIKHYSELRHVFESLVSEVKSKKPKFVLLMDYPGFNLRLAKKLKEELGKENIKIFYYISPQVWAWKKDRIHDIKKYCDNVYLLFPFEKEFYDKYQVPYEFVGHPLLEDLDPDLFDNQKIKLSRQKYGIQNDEKVLALMPGSRRSEIEMNFPIQLEVARNIVKKYDHVRIAILVAPTLSKDYILQFCENFGSPYILLKDDPNKMISMADVVLATSGTATLMVGLLHKPMVIMYRMKWLTGVIAKLIVRGVKYFGLVNLVLDEQIVPESMQSDATADKITPLIEKYILDDQYYADTVKKLEMVRYKLGDVGATERVGSSLMKYL